MKTIIITVGLIIAMSSVAIAWTDGYNNKRPYKDSWGNSYKYRDNLYKDTDRDGVINKYDYNDRDRNIQNPYQREYDYGRGSRSRSW
ncbi:MAG: hypothetical protein N3A62_10165 [Thermodesulfovibrionales bacterium]|nr:hypothetical protein [Thermodesulfovibrionales bacterium]